MCLIVVKNKADASFSVKDFKSSFTRNSDGTGIMYIENGRVVVEKVFSKEYKDHLDLYYKHMNKPQFILHHRMATHGEKSEFNIHPFQVLSIDEGDPFDLWFAHNGVISMNKFSNDIDKRLSDTHAFATAYLRPLMKQYPHIIDNEIFQIMLHDFLGTSNKLAFLRSDGMTFIFNKSAGDEHNGCWLSNKYSIACDTYTHGSKHGTSNRYNNVDDYYEDYYGYNYECDDNSLFNRDRWATANNIKHKAPANLTTLKPDDIFKAIEEYKGQSALNYEALFVEEPELVYDMINMLTIGEEVSKKLLDDSANIVGGKLFTIMQNYEKKLAA